MSTDDSPSTLPAGVTVEPWIPTAEVETDSLSTGTIYVLPTRTISGGEESVVFDDSVRFLPKYVRAAGYDAQFAPSAHERRFLSEYSHDPGDWQLALTFIGFLNDWVVMAVNTWLSARASMTGMSETEVLEHEMELDVAEWEPKKGKFSGLRIRGKGSDVIAAVRELGKLGD
ncbi:hypothetical protein M0722_13770 [Microbacterium sp. KSW4-16]|uniref:hypothetical protein n=1 Tax=Microbacterium aurugineum TaxID=2851642 RepID=UPI0020BDB0EE|nr:hypothetical protein [Microbacterium aurugineum]MCK8468263.1 hypothetical protein [Microbacterium aurugineum]